LSLDGAVAKVLKPHEGNRIHEAFALLAGPPKLSNSTKTSERQDNYRRFLKQINNHDCGPQFVVICAVGLGQSAINLMKDARFNLPEEIKKRAIALSDLIFNKIVAEHRTPLLFKYHL
jgi:hypothetical protein